MTGVAFIIAGAAVGSIPPALLGIWLIRRDHRRHRAAVAKIYKEWYS